MNQWKFPDGSGVHKTPESIQPSDRKILEYITDIGASLRLQMDTDTLLKRVADAVCQALHFRHSALYLSDNLGNYRVCATSGISADKELYLKQHPLPGDIVALLVSEEYRLSDSYFIPGEATIWQNETINSFFVVAENTEEQTKNSIQDSYTAPADLSGIYWDPQDLFLIPLVSGETTLLGFLTPDAPISGLRPTADTALILELFANQAAVVIEGARLYEETLRSSEERAVLIEIGRALSSPQAQSELQAVYQTLYEQVKRVIPIDAFFVSHYYAAQDKLVMEYLIDEGIVYPPEEYVQIRPFTRRFLTKTEGSRLFSTSREFIDALNYQEDEKDIGRITAGNQRLAESMITVPICYADEVIGIISAQSYLPHAFTLQHMAMLEQIGVQAAIAMTNARLYGELREALKQAQESERLKNHFLMTASHELRTPLTAIQGYLELLGSFGNVLDHDSKNRFISSARRACEELVLLLNNVMDTSRIDQDRVSLNLTSVQVLHTVSVILEILEPTFAREKRPVRLNIAEDLRVWADDLRLRQILLNLVGNALKYTPAPTAIEISAKSIVNAELQECLINVNQPAFQSLAESDQYVIIAIRDWGQGISLADQTRLFTKFMRLDSAMNSIQRGAGLGLYLCRQLTDVMGGRIWVESQGIDGEGTTFFVALPQYQS